MRDAIALPRQAYTEYCGTAALKLPGITEYECYTNAKQLQWLSHGSNITAVISLCVIDQGGA